MARKPRVHFPGAVYHVMLRGNGGENIFFSPGDRSKVFFLLQEGVERFEHRIHAFCLMNNHIHLAVQVGDVPLSKIIQNVSFRYTRWLNWRRGKTGHLFQGRYKALLVDMDIYLVELIRYIHLNPVRAGLVKEPGKFQYSSHRSYLSLEEIPWLTTTWCLGQFGTDLSRARHGYKKYMDNGLGGGHDEKFHSGSEYDSRALGDDNFLDKIFNRRDTGTKATWNLEDIESDVCRAYSLTRDELHSRNSSNKAAQARALIGIVSIRSGCTTLTATANYFSRDVATLSTGVRRLTFKIKEKGMTGGPWGDVLNRYNVKA